MGDSAYALLITLMSGLAMGVGALVVFFVKKENKRTTAFSMGFSAGAMLLVAFIALMGHSLQCVGQETSLMMFSIGLIVMALLDKMLPSHAHNHPNSVPSLNTNDGESEESVMFRTGIAIAVAIALHNIPEGVAIFTSSLADRETGMLLSVAVMLHNIPIGVAIATPIYLATNNKLKAISIALLTGLISPLAALLCSVFMMPFLSDGIVEKLLPLVAGIMVYICVDELLPASRKQGFHHISTYGVVVGMICVAVVLMFLGGGHSH